MLIGYMRVSSNDERQSVALHQDHASGGGRLESGKYLTLRLFFVRFDIDTA